METTVLALALLAAPVKQPENLPFGKVYSPEGLSHILLTCAFLDERDRRTPAPTNRIQCDLAQVTLVLPDEALTAKVYAVMEKAFEEAWKKNRTRDKKDPMKDLQRTPFCANPGGSTAWLAPERQRLATYKYATAFLPPFDAQRARENAAFARLCACTTETCVHDAQRAQLLDQAREDAPCAVSATFEREVEFKRVGSDWVSVNTNSNACTASSTKTLSKLEDSKGWALRYVNVPRSVSNPSTSCSGKVEEVVYSSADSFGAVSLIALNCKTLTF